MKTTTKQLSDTQVLLTIKLEASELEAAEQVALKKLAHDLKVPGFRKGHVPTSVAAKHVNPNTLQEETLNNALSKAVADAFMHEKLQALDRPAVEVKKFVPGSELEFTAEVEIVPEVKLGNYKKLKAKAQQEEVTDADVDEIITRMQQNFTDKKSVTRPAQDGDEVRIDFVGKRDGVAFDGGTAKNYDLKLGAGQFIPGFEEGIVGKKPGEMFTLDLKFPKDYHAKELAGAAVAFDVTLHTVNELQLPELNDEFAAKCGPFTDMKGLKADITREIGDQKKREAEEKLKDALVMELVDKSTVAAPQVLVDDQMRSIEQDMTQNLSYRGVTLDSYLTTSDFKDKDDWLEREVKPAAEKRVKAGLVLAELSKELKIDVSRDELDAQLTVMKQHYGQNKDMLKQFDDPNVHRDIANRMVTDKTVAKLVELNS